MLLPIEKHLSIHWFIREVKCEERRGEHSINLLFFKTPGVGLHPKSRETISLKRNCEMETSSGLSFDLPFVWKRSVIHQVQPTMVFK